MSPTRLFPLSEKNLPLPSPIANFRLDFFCNVTVYLTQRLRYASKAKKLLRIVLLHFCMQTCFRCIVETWGCHFEVSYLAPCLVIYTYYKRVLHRLKKNRCLTPWQGKQEGGQGTGAYSTLTPSNKSAKSE